MIKLPCFLFLCTLISMGLARANPSNLRIMFANSNKKEPFFPIKGILVREAKVATPNPDVPGKLTMVEGFGIVVPYRTKDGKSMEEYISFVAGDSWVSRTCEVKRLVQWHVDSETKKKTKKVSYKRK